MKRAIALLSESDIIGGAENMILNLGSELLGRGWEVHFLGPRKGSGWLGARMSEAGANVHQFHLRRALDPACLRGIMTILRDTQVQLAHSHMFAMAAYGGMASWRLGLPHVITMHGDAEQTRYLRRRAALRWAFRRAKAVVAVSAAMKQDLACTLGPVARRVQVVVNGVPAGAGDRAGTRAALGIDSGTCLLLAVGSYCHRKGHDILMRAVASMPTGRPWLLALAGPDGGAGAEWRELATRDGLAGRVLLLGPRPDIVDLLAACDIFVMPSLWEGLPLALLEAMFAAKPIIATAVGGIPEAVRTGAEALLVPPGDEGALREALTRLMNAPDLAANLGRAALNQARCRYSVTAMTDAYEAIYHAA